MAERIFGFVHEFKNRLSNFRDAAFGSNIDEVLQQQKIEIEQMEDRELSRLIVATMSDIVFIGTVHKEDQPSYKTVGHLESGRTADGEIVWRVVYPYD